MPKLRRLNGWEVISILQEFGFAVEATKGSHYRLRRIVKEQTQSLTVPIHGNKALATGTLKSIFRQACLYIPEEKLRLRFYTD